MAKPKTQKVNLENADAVLLLVGALGVGFALGKLDTYIIDHVAKSNEYLSIAILLILTATFVYAWYSGVVLLRSFITKPTKKAKK